MSSDPVDPILNRRFRRGDFLKLGAAAAGASVLAACGSSNNAAPEPAAAPPATPEPAAAPPTPEPAPARPTIDQESGTLRVFEWAGYEYPTYGGKGGPLQPYVDKYGKPKFTFLTSDDQAIGKVRAGFKPDVVHPCVSYVKDWVDLGAVQPWDTSLIPSFKNLNPALVTNAQVDGKQYFLPLDWGFSSILYRNDKVEPQDNSWSLYFDERYKGKISWWDSPIENFLIFGYTQGFDPYNWDLWTDQQLGDAKKFLIEKKKLVRNIWSSETDMQTDFAAGNIWIAYAWGGDYAFAKSKKMDVTYMEPKEGRLSWNCGLVLGADTKNYYHAHEYAEAWASAASADWIIANYYYGHSNTTADIAKIDPNLVKVFHLDDPGALQEPKAHIERWVPDRRKLSKAWDEVKAA